MLSFFDVLSIYLLAPLALISWLVYGILWRLYLSPLACFPGPKLAALTLWYECYYDVFKPGGGMYIWEIEKMHQRYGPIVRVNPYELHIKDPEFYDQIYASAPHQRDKYESVVRSPDSDNATGFTTNHHQHRLRRDALSPFFSKRNVIGLEPRIKAKIELLCERLDGFLGTQKPINLSVAFLALTMDILTDYAFAEDFGLLQQEDFNIKWRDTILYIMQALPLIGHFKGLFRVIGSLPVFITRRIAPDVSQLLAWKEHIRGLIAEVLAHDGANHKVKRTIIEELCNSERLPPKEKSLDRLTDECSILLIAGSETPAKTLALIYYHLLANPSKLHRLRKELCTVMPNNTTLASQAQLERLPYLSAVIHEGLRLQSGIVSRSQRLAPDQLRYKQWVIPARTPISSISAFIHYDPDIYPGPCTFEPERWLRRTLEGEVFNHDLKRYLVAFGRGTRNCLGYNLGYAMLYLGTAAVASRYNMELFETDIRDVSLERDWTIPQPRVGSQGVRATVLSQVAV